MIIVIPICDGVPLPDLRVGLDLTIYGPLFTSAAPLPFTIDSTVITVGGRSVIPYGIPTTLLVTHTLFCSQFVDVHYYLI